MNTFPNIFAKKPISKIINSKAECYQPVYFLKTGKCANSKKSDKMKNLSFQNLNQCIYMDNNQLNWYFSSNNKLNNIKDNYYNHILPFDSGCDSIESDEEEGIYLDFNYFGKTKNKKVKIFNYFKKLSQKNSIKDYVYYNQILEYYGD